MAWVGKFGEIGESGWVAPTAALLSRVEAMPAAWRDKAVSEWVKRANVADDSLIAKMAADSWLRDLTKPFVDLPVGLRAVGLNATDEEICGVAERAAQDFFRFERIGYSLEALQDKAAKEYGLNVAVFDGKEAEGILGRLKDERFWRRQLRRFVARAAEKALREVGGVSSKSGLYVSNEGLRRRQAQKARNAALLATMAAVNELGQEFTLDELSAVGVSNPAIRRAELMVRIRGFEEIARLKGHVGEFFTLTCPSKFHKMHHFGKPNEKFNGDTPREVVAYLNKVWQRIRAELGRLDIKVYGFRVAEPHHDGTPHWHGLLFMPPESRDTFRRVVAKHGCREDREELGLRYFASKKEAAAEARQIRARLLAENGSAPTLKAIQAGLKTEADYWANKYFKFWKQTKASARVDFESINWARGSAAGYIAKYIAKNIDGKTQSGDSMGVDFESEELLDAATTAQRVDAWASIHGTRQFQQIGGVPVTLWRELRRIVPTDDDSVLMLAQRAADRGDWSAFVMLLGGEAVKRADVPLALYKEEAEDGVVNAYGETPAPYTLGVYEKSTGEVAVSRVHTWEVYKIGGTAAAWTRVNNCTKNENQPETAVFKGKNQPIDTEEIEFKEWLMWKKGVSAAQLDVWPFDGDLKAEFEADKDEIDRAETANPPMSQEAIARIIEKQVIEAEKTARQSENLRIYRNYLASLDRAALPVRAGIVPKTPKFDLSADKVVRKPRRYTPPQYDTVETALAKARAAQKETEQFNRRFD
ncbi:replication endonuclease [Neisseria brasiliensis]|uniref:replication endonuclease n=1 Tax=Neisseria TaxID=482 RepID=UPI000C27A709|nr:MULTISPECIES: replication endonuclease [Neisseria]PJO77124.1 replication endonuclease [Neisseria sp. N177_16]QGL24240.1 replication endonuclease [Neisseria brasiliensis]